MKRSWIGLGLLAVLLALGIVTSAMMSRIHEPVAWELEQAADCAGVGLWEQAQEKSEKAQRDWVRWEHFRGSLADHAPVEEIESLFAQLPVYCGERDAHFSAICRELSRKVSAMGQSHGLVWWNIL